MSTKYEFNLEVSVAPVVERPNGSALAAFLAAGIGFTGISLMQVGFHDTDMVGTNLASGLVSLLAAAVVTAWALTRRRVGPVYRR